MPVVLVGTQVEGKANFMTVGWCARANANPPMIVCGIGNHHYTPKGIAETKTFSVNIPSSDLLEKTDYCGLVSGEKTDKSQVFDVFYGSLKTAPMIRECPVTLECRLVQTVPLPTNTPLYRRNCRCLCGRQGDQGREAGFPGDRPALPDHARQPLLDAREVCRGCVECREETDDSG